MGNTKFLKKATRQLYSIMIDNENYEDNRELIMCIYSTAISRHFDTIEETPITDEEAKEYTERCWVSQKDDGQPVEQNWNYYHRGTYNEMALLCSKEKDVEVQKMILCKDFLSRTRKALCHGDFAFKKQSNGIDKVEIDDGFFRINYDFDCLVDVCKILLEKYTTKDLTDLIDRINNNDKFDVHNNEIDKKLFVYLYTMMALSFNQKEFENNIKEYSTYFGLRPNTDTKLRHSLKTIRNGIVHNTWNIQGNKIIIEDFEDHEHTIQSGKEELNIESIVSGASRFSGLNQGHSFKEVQSSRKIKKSK